MADETTAQSTPLTQNPRFFIAAGVIVLAVAGVGVWLWMTAGHITTDDAQVDAHVSQMAARVSGTILKVDVDDNQTVEAGYRYWSSSIRATIKSPSRKRARSSRMRRPPRSRRKAPCRSPPRRRRATSRRPRAASSRRTATWRRWRRKSRRRARGWRRRRRSCARRKPTARNRRVTWSGSAACSRRRREVSQQQFQATTAAAEAQKAGVDSARSQVTEAGGRHPRRGEPADSGARRRGARARGSLDGRDRSGAGDRDAGARGRRQRRRTCSRRRRRSIRPSSTCSTRP